MESIIVHSKILKAIIKQELGIDIMDKCRKRDIVDARLIYVRILLEEGYSILSVGRSMKKHHSTVIHYIRSSEFAFKHIVELIDKYDRIKTKFLGVEEPVNRVYTRSQLIKQIETMEIELDALRKYKVLYEIRNKMV
jgi:hypothetical protein